MEELIEIQDVLIRLESSLPICRICLDVSMEYIEFESPLCVINGVEITYSDAFHEVSSFVYEMADKVPTNLCSACGNDLLSTYLFLKRVENTNCILEKVKCLTKAEAKVSDIGRDEFVENLKVEILSDPNGAKYLDLLTSVKLENQTESAPECCARSESSKRILNEIESSEQISLENKADINSMCVDEFVNKNSDDEELVLGDENSEICETENVGQNDSPKICSQCDLKFLSENELNEHLLYHDYSEEHNTSIYNCILCKQNFKTKALLMIHANVHRDRRRYTNLTAFHKKINAKYHQWRNHRSFEEKKKKCQESKDDLPLSSKLNKSHVIQQTEASDFMCNFCGKKCVTAIGLKSHSRAHKERKFICHICSKMCSTEATLKRHIDHIHLSDCKKYQCEDCGLVFKYPSYLRDHQRKHDTQSKYKCPFCDRSYCRKPQFDIHLRYHYNDYRYKCNHCDKGYATKSNLTDHIKSSHIKITYDCDECDQKFKSVTGLKKHKYSHTGYPYNCPLCLLGQASRSGIKTHIFGVHKGAITVDEFNKMFPLVNPKSGYRRPKVKSIE